MPTEKIYTFKEGDRVKLIGSYYSCENNPVWGGSYRCGGTYIAGGQVKWDNGITNVYGTNGTTTRTHTLALLSKIEEDAIINKKTVYKTEQAVCPIMGEKTKILAFYDGRDVSRYNMSLAGYKKFVNSGSKRWSNKPIVGSEKGLIKSERTFGVELECTTNTYLKRSIADFLINPNYEADSDGSVSGVCREYKTPVLQNKAGEDSLMETCAMLQDVGFYTNSTCGTHVHIGVPESKDPSSSAEDQEHLKNLLIFYKTIDPMVNMLLPRTRRNNRFARPMDMIYSGAHINKLKADKRFDFFWFKTADDASLKAFKSRSCYGEERIDRYSGINFNSLSIRGTLEVRYHQGTLDAPTLIHWIGFHAGIVDFVMSGKITEEEIEGLKKIKDTREMLVTVLEMIKSFISKKTMTAILDRYDTFNSPDWKAPEEPTGRTEEEDEEDWDSDDDEDDY